MDAFHHHQPRRLIGPPVGGDQPPPPTHQNPFWYPSSSPPPPPGGYHHHLSPRASASASASSPLPHQQNYLHQPSPYPPPPQQQWDRPGDTHHHLQQQHPMPPLPPYPQAPSYHNHPLAPPYPAAAPPPHRYPPPPHPHHHNTPPPPHPPHPSAYPPPNQAWGSSSWAQHQGWEFPERNIPYNNEEDWAARARAWASAKSVTEYNHTPSQFTPIGRIDEHNYAHHDQYQQVGGPPTDMQQPSFPQSRDQHLPDLYMHRSTSFSSASSYRADRHVLYSAGDETKASNTDHMASPHTSYGLGSSICEQEVPYSYSSAPGNRDAVDHSGSSRIPLPLPVSSVQEGLLYPQSTLSMEQPHFSYGEQSTRPLTDPSDLPLDFEPRSASGHEPHQKTSYGHADPAGSVGVVDHDAIATSIHAWNPSAASGVTFSQIPIAPSGTQFDTSFISQPPLPIHQAPAFGTIPGPNFRPTIPPVSGPFGLGAGTSVHHAVAFPVDGNGTFNLSERPKKAAVPNWLREEIIKKKSVIASAVPTQPTGNSFHSIGSEDADKSFRTANQADTKSIDSTKSTEDEEDDEDELEAARSAAINQEIKRVLTEVLLKVTDELFDEIATKVLNEDDLSVEAVDESAVMGNHKVPPSPPAVPTPKASAKILVQVKRNNKNTDGASENSRPSSPGGDVLGLANYASDDDVETENSTLLSSGIADGSFHQQESNDRSSENLLIEVNKGNTLSNSQDSSLGPINLENVRSRMDVNGVPWNSNERSKEGNGMTGHASRSTENLYSHDKAPKGVSGIPEELLSVVGGKANEVPVQNANVLKPKDMRLESTFGTANNGKSVTGEFSVTESKGIIGTNRNLEKRGNNRDIVKEVKVGMDRSGRKTSDVNDSTIHDDRNVLKKQMDKRDDLKEKFVDKSVKRGANERDSDTRESSKHESVKDDKKETSKGKREKSKEYGERKREQTRDQKEDRSTRVTKDSSRYNSKRSSSPGSRGRKSKENSSFGHGSASSDEPSENSRKRRLPSNRRSLSPSPTRSRKRQVSRSPHSKHSHRRDSPYSSTDRRRRSRSRTPVQRRSAHKHVK